MSVHVRYSFQQGLTNGIPRGIEITSCLEVVNATRTLVNNILHDENTFNNVARQCFIDVNSNTRTLDPMRRRYLSLGWEVSHYLQERTIYLSRG